MHQTSFKICNANLSLPLRYVKYFYFAKIIKFLITNFHSTTTAALNLLTFMQKQWIPSSVVAQFIDENYPKQVKKYENKQITQFPRQGNRGSTKTARPDNGFIKAKFDSSPKHACYI